MKNNINFLEFIKSLLFLGGLFFIPSGAIWTWEQPNNPWLWFSRASLGILCLGLLGIIKAIESKK